MAHIIYCFLRVRLAGQTEACARKLDSERQPLKRGNIDLTRSSQVDVTYLLISSVI